METDNRDKGEKPPKLQIILVNFCDYCPQTSFNGNIISLQALMLLLSKKKASKQNHKEGENIPSALDSI